MTSALRLLAFQNQLHHGEVVIADLDLRVTAHGRWVMGRFLANMCPYSLTLGAAKQLKLFLDTTPLPINI